MQEAAVDSTLASVEECIREPVEVRTQVQAVVFTLVRVVAYTLVRAVAYSLPSERLDVAAQSAATLILGF